MPLPALAALVARRYRACVALTLGVVPSRILSRHLRLGLVLLLREHITCRLLKLRGSAGRDMRVGARRVLRVLLRGRQLVPLFKPLHLAL